MTGGPTLGPAVLWWGVFCFCIPQPHVLVAVFSPIMMTILLRYVSGVRLLEQSLSQRKPGYEDYVAKVPAFIPRIPGLQAKAHAKTSARKLPTA